jgi:hypothetical protein
MNKELPGVLWGELGEGERVSVKYLTPWSIALILSIRGARPRCGSGFVRELIREIVGEKFMNRSGLCGLISSLLKNPNNYPANLRAEVNRLRPEAEKRIRVEMETFCQGLGKDRL